MQRCYKSAEYPGGMPFGRSRSAIMGEMAGSLAHELNQALGAENAEGGGAQFCVRLPTSKRIGL
jgi:hypothetical protein